MGATASFGPPLVRGFLRDGAMVLATARHPPPTALDHPDARFVPLDILDVASQERFVDRVVAEFGALDVVVMTPGILPGKSIDAYDDDLMDTVMATNVTRQAGLIRRLMPHMADGSQVWMTSSISGARGSFDPLYAASKAAVVGLVKSLATWHAPRVRTNAIAPAVIEDSAMFLAMKPERREHHRLSTPTGRPTTPAELAEVLIDLCRPAWANLNGQVIHLNGGAHV